MKDKYEDYRETLEEAKDIEKALKLDNLQSALLIMLIQYGELIRFS